MNINTLKTLPDEIGIAFSGGIDSAVMLNKAITLGRKVSILVFDHNTALSEEEISFAIEMAKHYGVSCQIGFTDEKNYKESKEAFWHRCRYKWFHSLPLTIATGHHLNDVAEWYLMTALNGHGGYILQYNNRNVIRPLLAISKEIITEYAGHHDIHHITDYTNNDISFNQRNKVRALLLPAALNINPGLLNTLKRRIMSREFDPV